MNPGARLFAALAALILVTALSSCRKTTRLLVVNALPAQTAEIVANNNDSRITVTSVSATEARAFADYDAVMIYSRGIYFDSLQTAQLRDAAAKGTVIYSNDGSGSNITPAQADTLTEYLRYPCQQNYAALLDYFRSLAGHSAAPARQPVTIPEAMYYHIEPGHYFESIADYRNYLRQIARYHTGAPSIALICGTAFPVEGNRQHVDSLISRLGAEGYNVYPISAHGRQRNRMICESEPDAVIFLPMGRLADDSLVDWLHQRGTPLFMPFPLTLTHDDWMNPDIPLTAGTLTARVTVPEIDGGITPTCIATQNPDENGYIVNTLEPQQLDRFIARLRRTLSLRTKPNADKRIAIVYFKMPGHDALVASGMEVVPSLYAFLKRLKAEGYIVDNLPPTEKEFANLIEKQGAVMGSYASEAQQQFMDSGNPLWFPKNRYEQMVSETLQPEKYQETVERYGPAPGRQLSRGDSIAVAALRFGNILILPQPRPALGDDEFKIVHGAKVAPPHSYIAPYLYIQREFGADALIHFGTHGNLEFLPGNNAALSFADWSEALAGAIPHFYFYTIANVGEGIIAKRRTQAATVTYLTPPFIESGMRSKLSPLIEAVHRAISSPAANTVDLKRRLAAEGFIGDLGLDSVSPILNVDELERIDSYIEELAAEKVTGSFYVMGRPYTEAELTETQLAMGTDQLAYSHARDDFHKGLITDSMLNNQLFISHHYLPAARAEILKAISARADTVGMSPEMREIMRYRRLLVESAGAELDAMVAALSGVAVNPTPGGDPIALPNVLPTGRNLYSINVEATPDDNAWLNGQRLAETSLADYYRRHDEYPRKVNYTFWAGEFITSRGTTIAQALQMLGVEPVRDSRGRAVDLRLIPSAELGRPRIDVTIQVSGQLRDIAASRLKMVGDAVRLAAEAADDIYPNYVRQAAIDIERNLAEKGESPLRARQLSTKRIFGPVNNGYSTGMLGLTERSGEWEERTDIARAFLIKMCAVYDDEAGWGIAEPELLETAITNLDLIVQPRQSNTWGPVSLDHVYEFTGGLSLAATTLSDREPDAIMADYRNPRLPRLQSTDDAVAVELRASLLNPTVVAERMKGDAGTAESFGESFRNIFGWSVMRQSSLPPRVYDELYDMYVADKNNLGLYDFFNRTNPAAFQEMTATMLESARKGYWKPSDNQIANLAEIHAKLTAEHGAPCTEFVCANRKLQKFIAGQLADDKASQYLANIDKTTGGENKSTVLTKTTLNNRRNLTLTTLIAVGIVAILIICIIITIKRRKHENE